MGANIPEEFPRQEFRQSKLPYQLAAYAASMILPLIVIKTVSAILPPVFSSSLFVGLVAWCSMVVGCLIVLTKLLSRMDFEKPVVTIEPNAVIFSEARTRMLPWTSISKIKFYESGQLRQTKTFVFHMAGGGKETFSVSQIAGISAWQLFDTIKIYHRKFGPQPAQGSPSYDSSAWTGVDND